MPEGMTKGPLPEAEFARQVRDALGHLYDYTHLRRHPLALLFFPEPTPEGPGHGPRLHRLLLEAIEALSPPQQIPFHSRRWRGYRILSARYVEEQGPQEIMEELAISRRQFFREQRKALQALVSLLWENHALIEREVLERRPAADRKENRLLLTEAERVMGQPQSIALPDLLEGILEAIRPLGEAKGVTVSTSVRRGVPAVYANRTLLRQVFIQALSRLITSPEVFRVHLNVERWGRWVSVEGRATSHDGEEVSGPWAMESVQHLVKMLGGEWRTHPHEDCLGFVLPTNEPRTLLAIDDNEGLIHLLRRYLAEHNYRVAEASNGSDAMQLARTLQPDVITLDVMMPSQDGWEVLQLLKSRPDTRSIPIVICSVLDDPEVAFSLGAEAYLKKPISQTDLLRALASLKRGLVG